MRRPSTSWKICLPRPDDVDHALGLGRRVQPHRRLGVELRQAERHDGHRRELGEPVEHAGQRVVEHVAVVDAGAHHDLAAHLDAVIEQRPQPPQAHAAALVLQHPVAHVVVGRVDRHVQRRQALGDHPLEVGLGEPGERGEVAVQEAQPVVVVLQVQAPPHALGQLVDEAELAVVVARAHPVEHGRLHLDAERLAGPLRHGDRQLDPTADDVELDVGLVGAAAATR